MAIREIHAERLRDLLQQPGPAATGEELLLSMELLSRRLLFLFHSCIFDRY